MGAVRSGHEGGQLPRWARLSFALALVAAVAGVVTFVVMDVFASSPPYVDYAAGHLSGKPVTMTIESDPTTGFGPLAPSVTYMFKEPTGSPDSAGSWVHSTQFTVPARTRVEVTAYEFDTGDPLRNQVWGQVTGTMGDEVDVDVSGCQGFCGSQKVAKTSVSLIDSNVYPYIGHTFSLPALGINVPLKGLSPLTPPTKICASAPCLPSQNPHTTTTFSFVTPGPGTYRWQCFIPCGYSYFDGNGGPMATIGYMTGFMRVE